ncbi:MAG: DUF6268 family outer membrane beta-barrel protein [Bacteroidota bacterium]
MKKYIILFLIASLWQHVIAQVTGEVNVLDRDIFYIQYTPETGISDDINYQKWSSKLGLPPIRSGKLSIFNTLGLDVHAFDYGTSNLITDTGELEGFYNVNYSLFIHHKFSDKWSLNALATPFLLSNFEGDFSEDDFDFNGNIFLERTFFRKKGGYIKLGLGVGYMTLNGTKQVTPISQLKARFNEKLSIVLGIPNTYVKWDFHKRHSLKILGDLNDFSANLSGDNTFLNNSEEEKIVFTTVAAGLEYNLWVTPSVGIMVKGTYPIWGEYEIRDSDDASLFGFDASFDRPFIGVGLKFNPIRSLQNSLNPL